MLASISYIPSYIFDSWSIPKDLMSQKNPWEDKEFFYFIYEIEHSIAKFGYQSFVELPMTVAPENPLNEKTPGVVFKFQGLISGIMITSASHDLP